MGSKWITDIRTMTSGLPCAMKVALAARPPPETTSLRQGARQEIQTRRRQAGAASDAVAIKHRRKGRVAVRTVEDQTRRGDRMVAAGTSSDQETERVPMRQEYHQWCHCREAAGGGARR